MWKSILKKPIYICDKLIREEIKSGIFVNLKIKVAIALAISHLYYIHFKYNRTKNTA